MMHIHSVRGGGGMTSPTVLKSKRGVVALAISLLMLIGGFALIAPMEEADAATPVAILYVSDGSTYNQVGEYADFDSALTAYNGQSAGDYLIELNGSVTNTSSVFLVKQLEGLNLILDGNNNDFCGILRIDGRTDQVSPESLTIRNFNFKGLTGPISTFESYIWSADSQGVLRYPHNVTISDCTFELANDGLVGIKMKQAKNITIEGCYACGGFDANDDPIIGGHSLAQIESTRGLTITGCDVYCNRGIATGNSMNVQISDCIIEAADGKYGIRMDGDFQDEATEVVIEDCEIKAGIPVVVRDITDGKDMEITFEGTNDMVGTNTDGLWFAAGAQEYPDVSKDSLTGDVKVNFNDTSLDTTGATGFLVQIAELTLPDNTTSTYWKLEDALAAYDTNPSTGDYTITLLENINKPTTTYIVKQWANKNLELNGDDKEFTAQIAIYGQSRSTGPESLLITGFSFTGDVNCSSESGCDHVFIALNDGGNALKRYPHKVTIDNCTFVMPVDEESIGIKIRQGYDFTISNCEFYNGALPVWMTGCTNVSFTEIYSEGSKEGLHTGTSGGTVSFDTIYVESDTYGIRLGGSPNDGWGAWNLKLKDIGITAPVPVVLRTVFTSVTGPIDISGSISAEYNGTSPEAWFVASETEYKGTGTIPDEDTGLVAILKGDAVDVSDDVFYGIDVHRHIVACEDTVCTVCVPNVTIPGLGGHVMNTTATCADRYCINCIDYREAGTGNHTPDSVHACNVTKCTACDEPLTPTDHTPDSNNPCEVTKCTVCLTPLQAGSHERENDDPCVDTVCMYCGDEMPATADHVFGSTATCINRVCSVCDTTTLATTDHDYRISGHQKVCSMCGDAVNLPIQEDDDDDWYDWWLAQQAAKAEAERLAQEQAEEEEKKKVAAVAVAVGAAVAMVLLLMTTPRN